MIFDDYRTFLILGKRPWVWFDYAKYSSECADRWR